MKAIKFSIVKYMCLFCAMPGLTACHTTNKGMSSSEYHDYLREDTVICILNTYSIKPSFELVLDTVIQSWKNCPVCQNEPYPFVFEIEEALQGETLIYTIKTNSSPKIAHHYYSGAFRYETHLFAVIEKSTNKSSFDYDGRNKLTKLYFCDRIHSSECGLIIEFKSFDDCLKVTNVECQTKEIIKIK